MASSRLVPMEHSLQTFYSPASSVPPPPPKGASRWQKESPPNKDVYNSPLPALPDQPDWSPGLHVPARHLSNGWGLARYNQC